MTVVRVKRKERDFFQAKKEIFSKNLSLRVIGLWSYAMSCMDDWDFRVDDLVARFEEGRDAIYTALQKLIEAGYCYHHQPRNADGTFSKGEYIIFETLDQREEFLKSLSIYQLPENPEAVSQETAPKGAPYIYNKNISNDISLIFPLKNPKKAIDENVKELAQEVHTTILKFKEDFTKSISAKWVKDCEKLLKKRDKNLILKVLRWALQDKFWSAHILSPHSLFEKLDKLEILMKNDKSFNFKEHEREKCLNQEQKEFKTISLDPVTLEPIYQGSD